MQSQKQKTAKSRLPNTTANKNQQQSQRSSRPLKSPFIDKAKKQRSPHAPASPPKVIPQDDDEDDNSEVHDIYNANDHSSAASVNSTIQNIQPDATQADNQTPAAVTPGPANAPQQPEQKRQISNAAVANNTRISLHHSVTDQTASQKKPEIQDKTLKLQQAMRKGIMDKYQAMLQEKRNQAKEQIVKATTKLPTKEGGMDANELAIENERLKTTLTVLNQKLNAQQDFVEQIDTNRKQIDQQDAELLKLKIENQDLIDQNNQKTSLIADQKVEIQNLLSRITTHETTKLSINQKNDGLNHELKITGEARNVLKNDNDFLHAKVLSLEEQLHETKQELHETKLALDEANQVAVDLLEQIRDLESQLQSAHEQIGDLESQLQQSQEQNRDLESQLQQAWEQIRDLESQLQQSQEHNRNLESQLQQTQEQNRDLESQLQQAQEQIGVLQSQLQQTQEQNRDLESKLQQSQQQNRDLESQLQQAQEQIRDLEFQLQQSQQHNKALEFQLQQGKEENRDLQFQLQQAHEQIRDLEFQLQQAQAKIADLLQQVDFLKKNQAIYIPKKNDTIDVALSTFINKFPEREKMNILFLRESEGVYQFGQKRVYVKIDKGNQIQVRVGGGYMHIDQFIQQYTPLEVEKIERTNVIDRFADKLIMQKISSNVANVAQEQSPIRSPQRPRSVNKREAMGATMHTTGRGKIRNSLNSKLEASGRNPFGSPSSKKSTMKKGHKSPVTQRSNRRQTAPTKQHAMSPKKGSQPTSPKKSHGSSMPNVEDSSYNVAAGEKGTM